MLEFSKIFDAVMEVTTDIRNKTNFSVTTLCHLNYSEFFRRFVMEESMFLEDLLKICKTLCRQS